jgi:hypothetical protein
MNNEKNTAEDQPISESLMSELPVNYYLFVKTTSENFKTSPLCLRSDFHDTDGYLITPFYKSISSIL